MTVTILPVSKPRVVHTPYLILAALQVLNVVFTAWVLHFDSGVTDGNPLLEMLFGVVGLYAGLGLLLAFKLLLVYLLWVCQTGTRIILAIYAIVVINSMSDLFLWLF